MTDTMTKDADTEAESRPSGFEKTAALDEVKLMPGDALQLQPLLEGLTERFTVRIIGVMKPRSVLVTAPVADGKLIFVRESQPFLVRAFSGLNVCAFKSKVLKAPHSPFPYLHLAYPDSVQLMRIRKSVRARVDIIVAIQDREGGRQLAAGRIIDLSVGGARIHSASQFAEKGRTVFLSFKIRLDDIEEYINIPAVIRSITDDTSDEGRRVKSVGVQFDELAQHDRLLIMNVVYQYLLKEND